LLLFFLPLQGIQLTYALAKAYAYCLTLRVRQSNLLKQSLAQGNGEASYAIAKYLGIKHGIQSLKYNYRCIILLI
jgi:hypothetical protein